jgi:hypothetical protein
MQHLNMSPWCPIRMIYQIQYFNINNRYLERERKREEKWNRYIPGFLFSLRFYALWRTPFRVRTCNIHIFLYLTSRGITTIAVPRFRCSHVIFSLFFSFPFFGGEERENSCKSITDNMAASYLCCDSCCGYLQSITTLMNVIVRLERNDSEIAAPFRQQSDTDITRWRKRKKSQSNLNDVSHRSWSMKRIMNTCCVRNWRKWFIRV